MARCAKRPIPEGLVEIARCFNAGNERVRKRVPKGRLEFVRYPDIEGCFQPSLRDLYNFGLNPALKRRAITAYPFRDTN